MDVYRSMLAIGRSKRDAQQDAFGYYKYHTTEAKPVDYSEYQKIDKKFRTLEQQEYDRWSRELEKHKGDVGARGKATDSMRHRRDVLNKQRETAMTGLLEMTKVAGEKVVSKPKVKTTDIQAIQAIHDSRSPRSRESDERQSNADTIEPDDPRVDIWERDPGRMDVSGIDTPKKGKGSGKGKRVSRKVRKDSGRRVGKLETQLGGLRGKR